MKGSSSSLDVYTQTLADLENFVYQENMPGMSEMTVCFWFQAFSNTTGNFIVSLASTRKFNHETSAEARYSDFKA